MTADASPVYVPKPIKKIRPRRTKATMDSIRKAMIEVVERQHPITVRGTFYQLTKGGLLPKLENQYKRTVVRLLTDLRLAGEVPFDYIADNTRWMRKPTTFDSAEQAIKNTALAYRRDLWSSAPAYVEIWCEKDALAGVLRDVTEEYDVPLMVTRGFSSITFLHSAAEQIAAIGKPAHIYAFADWDPSGMFISTNIERRLREFAPDAEIHFERVAVTAEQIEKWNLPTRPTKTTDSRAKHFKGESVELDAIDPDDLRKLVRGCIEQHLDEKHLATIRAAEQSEKTWLTTIAEILAKQRSS